MLARRVEPGVLLVAKLVVVVELVDTASKLLNVSRTNSKTGTTYNNNNHLCFNNPALNHDTCIINGNPMATTKILNEHKDNVSFFDSLIL